MTEVFSTKLSRIGETVRLALAQDCAPLAAALERSARRPALAIGSGGSAIVADYFATIRAGLGHAPTVVATPMALSLDALGGSGRAIWLFSASGDNADILTAFEAAGREHEDTIDVLTSRPEGRLCALAQAASATTGRVHSHAAAVAEPKDGFLATHSSVSAAVRLLAAADDVAGGPPAFARVQQLVALADARMAANARKAMRNELAKLADCDTLFVLHDPYLSSAALTVETSFWEAGLWPVQRTDFRNFAHGRHVWMTRRAARTFVLALTCSAGRDVWRAMRSELPIETPVVEIDFGREGRAAAFDGLLTALSIVEAAGQIQGVDPGKPGVGEFGRRLFEQRDLEAALASEPRCVTLKRRAERKIDPVERSEHNWIAQREAVAAALAAARIKGLVLDYDGTVVATERRLEAPDADLLGELLRLAQSGIRLAIATGRGGSVGEELRRHIPEATQSEILIGYYNGGHIATLAQDIRDAPPKSDPVIAAVHKQLAARPELFVIDGVPKRGELQLTLHFAKFADPIQGPAQVAAIVRQVLGANPEMPSPRILRSGHTIDIFPQWASKPRVVDAVRRLCADPQAEILCIGDNGDIRGNDFDFLGGHLGLSVDRICHRADGCWNPMPAGVSGPEGLWRILAAISVGNGFAKLDVHALFRI